MVGVQPCPPESKISPTRALPDYRNVRIVPPALLDARAAAELLGVGPSMVAVLASSGELRAFRDPVNRLVFLPEDVEALRAKRARSTP